MNYVCAVATVHAVHARRAGRSLDARDSVYARKTGHTHFTAVTFRPSRSLWSRLTFVTFRSF